MKRILLTLAALAGPATAALAQVPGAGAIPGAGALPAAAAPGAGQNVTVTNKCCSIWDFLGVGQAAGFINNQICKTSLFTGMNSVLSPFARALGLGPSLLSDKFAQEGGAMGLANQLKKEEKKVPLKVKAIRYLGTLDCQCYPEIVTQLLLSLDDCSEKVRYEALKALANNCGKGCCGKHKGGHHHKHALGGCKTCGVCDSCTDGDCPPCECPGCQCQKVVLDRLNKLLLERDEFGCLKEKSRRVRELATQMIEECLVRHQPHPEAETPVEPEDEKEEPIRDPGSSTEIQRSLPNYFGGSPSKPVNSVEKAPSAQVRPVQRHAVGYRGVVANAQAAAEEETVIILDGAPVEGEVAKPQKSWAPKRRHLWGELFGYQN